MSQLSIISIVNETFNINFESEKMIGMEYDNDILKAVEENNKDK